MIIYNFNPIVFRRLYNVHLKLKNLPKEPLCRLRDSQTIKEKIFLFGLGTRRLLHRQTKLRRRRRERRGDAIEMGNHKLKWTEEEEEALLAGVQKHGPGKWKNIIRDPEFADPLYNRSNIDLKVSSFLLSAVCSQI